MLAAPIVNPIVIFSTFFAFRGQTPALNAGLRVGTWLSGRGARWPWRWPLEAGGDSTEERYKAPTLKSEPGSGLHRSPIHSRPTLESVSLERPLALSGWLATIFSKQLFISRSAQR